MRYFLSFDTTDIQTLKTDTIIVGAGIAGLSAALQLTNLGIKSVIISKKMVGKSNSFLAQGGIAAAIGKDDNTNLHFQDTLKAGKGLCIEENVRILVEEGLERVIDLINIGVPFDKDKDVYIKLTKEGAHSKNRVLHVKDKTGYEIGKTLINLLKTREITLLDNYYLEEILTEDNRFIGAIITNCNEKILIKAKSIIIATGGYSGLFKRNTAAYKVSGDIISAAFRAGCILKDMEFIQFHPTAINLPEKPAWLISEAVRGEGAILIDEEGKRFIDELKPRDEVARAILQKELEGKKVYLDISPLLKKGIDFKERFPNVFNILKEFGLENETKIPVSPAAHYSIGGIQASINGKTDIDGIFAIGESSCTGVHGANRLASNSLLECIVSGYKVAYTIYQYNMYNHIKENIKIKNIIKGDKIEKPEREKILDRLKDIMWKKVGLIRSEKSLKEALEEILSIKDYLNRFENGRYLKDLINLSQAIIISALNRKESRGVHYREDYPTEDINYKKHTILDNRFNIKLV